ncbi:MAG: hypothetical protein IKY66_03895 [Bacteroidales bacterium]|nr:hypothetical protein [Bacteroidales bacterium]
MRPPKETKEEKFIRLAEARVNKILSMIRLLGNLSSTSFYQYSCDQVEQIFTALQLELIKNKMRFLQPHREKRKRFSLSEPFEVKEPAPKDQLTIAIPLPDGSYLRAVGYPNDSYPSITIYWDAQENPSSDGICFVEFNPDKEGVHRVCIGAYCAEEEDTKYYGPYITAERNSDEQH